MVSPFLHHPLCAFFWTCVATCWLALQSPAREAVLTATFGGDTLPEGWESDAHDGQNVTHEPLQEGEEAEARHFLRVTYLEPDRGPLALVSELPAHDSESFFTATLTARSPSGRSIRAGIRTRLRPHTYLASADISLNGEWSTIEIGLPNVPAATGRIEVSLELPGPGVVDLASFRLERRNRTEVAGEILSRHPDHAAGNLMRVSRFPLGLQSGMMLDPSLCDLEDVIIEADLNQRGPSGAASLRIHSRNSFSLFLPPFEPILTTDLHWASLSVRGAAEGRIVVATEDRTLAEASFRGSPNRWDRIALRFLPDETASLHTLRVEGSGTLWIDALQVSHGARERPYESQGIAEVALALPQGSASPARIQFLDETAEVRYAVTGRAAGHRLRGRIHNLYGETRELPPVALSGDFLLSGTWKTDLFPDRPLGTFRLEAWIEDRQGRHAGAHYELVFHRLRRPRSWGQDHPESFLGIHSNPARRHLLMAKAVGINWVALHDTDVALTGWHHLERAEGEWTFADDAIARYRNHHLQIVGQLGTAPAWASRMKTPHDADLDRFYQPENLEAFAGYVRTVTRRYRDSIAVYEVWQRPWRPENWAVSWSSEAPAPGYITSETPGADYARLQATAYQAAKASVPEVRIIGVNTTAGDSGSDWTREVIGNGALETCDIIGYQQDLEHDSAVADDTFETWRAAALDPIRDRAGAQPLPPVWLTSGSPALLPGNGLYRHTFPGEESSRTLAVADATVRFVLSALASGAEKVFLAQLHDHRFFGRNGSRRALVGDDGYLHPAGAAFSALSWHLDGASFVKRLELDDHRAGYLFRGHDGTLAVLTGEGQRESTYTIPAGAGLKAFDFLNNPLPEGSTLTSTPVYLLFAGEAEALEKRLLGE